MIKEKPTQFAFEDMPINDYSKPETVAEFALREWPDKSAAISFLERDIKRHCKDHERAMDKWEKDCVRARHNNAVPPRAPNVHPGAAICRTAIYNIQSSGLSDSGI